MLILLGHKVHGLVALPTYVRQPRTPIVPAINYVLYLIFNCSINSMTEFFTTSTSRSSADLIC